MKRTSLPRIAAAAAMLCSMLVITFTTMQAQTETVLDTFCAYGGSYCFLGDYPLGRLTPDSSGNLYGVTTNWALGGGTVFWFNPQSSPAPTVIYDFCSVGGPPNNCYDGQSPAGPLIFDSAGNLYGVTQSGGTYDAGTVFKLSPEPGGGDGCPSGTNPGINGWCETVLWSFCSQTNCADGLDPAGGLVMDSKGDLYGTETSVGSCICAGDPDPQPGVFELSPNGSGGWNLGIIYYVSVQYTPYNGGYTVNGNGGLAIDQYGNLYGADTNENVFELSRFCYVSGGILHCRWTVSNIHTFGTGTDGAGPNSPPIVDSAGNVYGTTVVGGTKNYGTVWKLTPITKGKDAGTFKERILHNFAAGKNGSYPETGVTLDSSGNIYGTTWDNFGAIFKLTVSGTAYSYKQLWAFDGADGYLPSDSPTLEGGNLYGTTFLGGPDYSSTYFDTGVLYEITP